MYDKLKRVIEENKHIVFFGGAGVSTESNIPDYIIRDYKKADGWEMVYNFCNDPVLAKKGKYYLMFYNKLTGILRVFYYNIYNVTTANTTLWKIGFNNKSALINSIDHFTLPADNQTTSFAYITNILDLPAKATSSLPSVGY